MRQAVGARRAAAAFLSFWDEHERAHFRIEEEVLLPTWASLDEEADHGMISRVLTEHSLIRTLTRKLEHEEPSVERLWDLGTLLERHIRFEEREVFALIELRLGPKALVELEREIAAAQSPDERESAD
jgi:hemerythrin-like domain-containing protein